MSRCLGISIFSSPIRLNMIADEERSTCQPRWNVMQEFNRIVVPRHKSKYLLGKCQQLRLICEEQEGCCILEGKALICSLFTAGNFISRARINITPGRYKRIEKYLMVPIKLSTKNLYSSAGASSLAFQTLL